MKTLITLSFIALTLHLYAATFPADDPRIEVRGLHYVTRSGGSLRFQRHAETTLGINRKELGINPDKARNPSGGTLAFRTDAATMTLKINILKANYMGAGFGVFENGHLIAEKKGTAKEQHLSLTITSQTPGQLSDLEIALPSFASVEIESLTLPDSAQLLAPSAAPDKIYVALGDSISHGVGQDGFGHLTWPFLVSRQLDMQLYNLAVGGGKISIPIAEMLQDWPRIDLITVLIGYNDLHFDKKTPAAYRQKYEELLNTLRATHPEARIVCITPLFTKKPINETTGHSVQAFRGVLTELVEQRQQTDPNLVLIQGNTLSSILNLRADQPKDPVHLSIEGAAAFAEALAPLIATE